MQYKKITYLFFQFRNVQSATFHLPSSNCSGKREFKKIKEHHHYPNKAINSVTDTALVPLGTTKPKCSSLKKKNSTTNKAIYFFSSHLQIMLFSIESEKVNIFFFFDPPMFAGMSAGGGWCRESSMWGLQVPSPPTQQNCLDRYLETTCKVTVNYMQTTC